MNLYKTLLEAGIREEWTKLPVSVCSGISRNYQIHLNAIIDNKVEVIG